MPEKRYDSTLARMAGNIAAGLVTMIDGGRYIEGPLFNPINADKVADDALRIADAIIERCEQRQTKQG